MSESGEDVESPGGREEEDWDLESEWAQARVEAGQPADPFDYPTHGYEFSPILLLYVGLFLGPFAPPLFILLLLKKQTPWRGFFVTVSVAVAGWLLLQGVTWVLQEEWSAFALQFMRSTCNFMVGVVAFVTVRSATKKSHTQTKGTLFNTAVALTVAVAIFLLLPRPWLWVLGR